MSAAFSHGTHSTEPCLVSSGAGAVKTPGLTVAIWGRVSAQTMVAIRFPPKAGRVCLRRPVSGSISRTVQSAVRPVLKDAATMGAMVLPKGVAP